MHSLRIIILLLLLSLSAVAQQLNLDSLLVVAKHQTGKDVVNTYLKASLFCMRERIDLDRAMRYADMADSVAVRLRLPNGHAEALWSQGTILMKLNKMDGSVAKFKAAISTAELVKDTVLIERNLNSMARAYLDMGKYDLATETADRAIDVARRKGLYERLIYNLRAKARIKMATFEFDEAKKIFDEAVRELNAHPHTFAALVVYESYATMLYELDQFEESLPYIERSVAAALQLNDTAAIASAYNIQGVILKAMREYKKSQASYFKALALNSRIHHSAGMRRNLTNLSGLFYTIGDLRNAFIYLDSCVRLLDKSANEAETNSVIHMNLGAIYSAIGDYGQAHRVLNQALKIDFSSQRNNWEIYYNLADVFEREGQADSSLVMNQEGYRNDSRPEARHQLRLQRAKILSGLHRLDSAAYYLNQINMALSQQEIPEGREPVQNSLQLDYLEALAFHEQMAGKFLDAALHYKVVAGKLDFWGNMEVYKALYQCYKASNQSAPALVAFESYAQLKDSIDDNLARYQQFQSLTRFRTLEKEKENVVLHADRVASAQRIRNTYTLAGAVAGVLFLLAGFYFYNNRRNQKANEVLKRNNAEIEHQRQRAEAALHELRETEAQLILAEKTSTIGQMIAGIAHEVNNPLNFILSGVEALKERMIDLKTQTVQTDAANNTTQAEQETLADIDVLTSTIAKGALRTKIVIDGLLKISRNHRGVVNNTNLLENLDMALLFLKPIITQKNITTTVTHNDVPLIALNASEINQAFVNILLNAVQAISLKGTIAIHIDSIDNKIRIAIHDSGQGIAPENLSKIFDPFFTTKEVGGGIGLGLSIARKIIINHGGTIHVESEQNRGTTVTVVLPGELKT